MHQTGRDPVGSLIPARIFEVAPGLAELAVGVVHGQLHGRPALDPRMREAAAISAVPPPSPCSTSIISSGGAGTVSPGEGAPSRVVWARARDGQVVERKKLA